MNKHLDAQYRVNTKSRHQIAHLSKVKVRATIGSLVRIYSSVRFLQKSLIEISNPIKPAPTNDRYKEFM